ncbi:DNA-3-methyladenine glycosylase family protein [Pedobacter nutrimenti]|uniref:DNA-3-methyladenine glycosylase II n=1 Tax=Pedobacter nutrimenti TaxID=1241337 RepID=A0A318UDD9_9SPHI|nr:DNA glycosylase [Pedobacter nutrimenti]PYF71480.1 DNA-3-methyladenine glycosylase II [Pedobacter nutrimenti]
MNSPLILDYPVPPLFSFKECLWFLNRNYDDCMHRISSGAITKAISLPEGDFLIRIAEHRQMIRMEILDGADIENHREVLEQYLKNWFDLDRDPRPLYELLKKDPQLSYMVTAFQGLRLVSMPDLFEALCWGITGQQINLSFAYKLKRRLVEKYGRSIEHEGNVYHLFPKPTALAKAGITDLMDMQFSQKKAEYLIGLSKAFLDGTISEKTLKALPSLKERQQVLTAIRGIGLWTANYALMKSFRENSCIPYGDVGLLNALIAHGIMQQKTDREQMDHFFEKYKGWESYLVFYLWRSLSQPEQ